jgi:hypothetical protein
MEEWLHPSDWPLWMAAFGVLAYALLVWLTWRRKRQPVADTGPTLPIASRPLPQASPRREIGTHSNGTQQVSIVPAAPLAMMDRGISLDDIGGGETAANDQEDVLVSAPEQAATICASLLRRAEVQLQSDDKLGAAASLREAIRLAAACDLSGQHAAARLELGELARQDGDLITACEHWQIARGLFHDLKNSARVKSTEGRMRDHGCPTDWVLTDF